MSFNDLPDNTQQKINRAIDEVQKDNEIAEAYREYCSVYLGEGENYTDILKVDDFVDDLIAFRAGWNAAKNN